ncbi:ABC transporter substrate-binding protein, partial [Enterococcus faecium]
ITSSGVLGKAVNQVTVGNEDVDQALADAQKITK